MALGGVELKAPGDWVERSQGGMPKYNADFGEARPLKAWTFKRGKKYEINGKWLRFLRKVGGNHLFQRAHEHARWLTCWTDCQLVGAEVKEEVRA
ncbi:MAG: hypothetical protein IJR68_04645 [Fretibacterium sp.]|nr:hypothetical protein [Fretibacterium sp.]